MIVQCLDGETEASSRLATESGVLASVADLVDGEPVVLLTKAAVEQLSFYLTEGSPARLDELVQLASSADFLDVPAVRKRACRGISNLVRAKQVPFDALEFNTMPPSCLEEVALGIDRDTCAEMAIMHHGLLDHLPISRFPPGGFRVCIKCADSLWDTITAVIDGAQERCVQKQLDQKLVYVDQHAEYDEKVRDRDDSDSDVSSIDLEEFFYRNVGMFVQEYGKELADQWSMQYDDQLADSAMFHAILTYAVGKYFHASWTSLPIGRRECFTCDLANRGVDMTADMTDAADEMCKAFADELAYIDIFDDKYMNHARDWLDNLHNDAYIFSMLESCGRFGLSDSPRNFLCKHSKMSCLNMERT